MGATAEARLSKRRINELEEKLKKLQRELRELKIEKKHAGHLRKQAERAAKAEAECREVLEQEEAERIENEQVQSKKPETVYKCRNEECVSAHGFYESPICDSIDVGHRVIVVCQSCGSRYVVEKTLSP